MTWPALHLPDMLCKVHVALPLTLLIISALLLLAWFIYPAPFSIGSLHPRVPGHGPTVTVLPFDNIGATTQQERMSITREITAELTRYDELFVMMTNSSSWMILGSVIPDDNRLSRRRCGIVVR